jgi:transcriptional regulator with XRE-family HTH domain
MDTKGFGSWLRRTRESRGLELKELAAACDIRVGTLGELELDNRRNPGIPGIEIFARIARGLDLELSYVLHKAGFDLGAGGVNLDRLHRIEMLMEMLDQEAPMIRRAIAEGMDQLDGGGTGRDETINRLGRALGALDLVTERVREGRRVA